MTDLIHRTPQGLYCPRGDFYIDPWKPVRKAILTHAHSDHARPGSQMYLAASDSRELLEVRLGNPSTDKEFGYLNYGEPLRIRSVLVTLYPAGHVRGSAQVCIEHDGERVVISGDYKRQADPTCTSFEPVRCHTFVTESTFGLPVYRWPAPESVIAEIQNWWLENQKQGKASLLLAYSLGKAQRILASLEPSLGPIYTHGAVERINAAYRQRCDVLPDTQQVGAVTSPEWSRSLVIAPPSALGSTWTRRLGKFSPAMASGWMQIRGTRRRRSLDRGFIFSDHVDWPDLLRSISETGAEQVWVTHGYSDVVVRYLQTQGLKALTLETQFADELERDEVESGSDQPPDAFSNSENASEAGDREDPHA